MSESKFQNLGQGKHSKLYLLTGDGLTLRVMTDDGTLIEGITSINCDINPGNTEWTLIFQDIVILRDDDWVTPELVEDTRKLLQDMEEALAQQEEG